MKRDNLQTMTADRLVEHFVVVGVKQDKALRKGEHAKFNLLFDEKKAIERELRSRAGDQRHILTNLYDHPNAQVRLNAEKATLAVAPESARRMLRTMADSREYPQAGDAGMTLNSLDRGIFKPI
jgi:hypothetical protein